MRLPFRPLVLARSCVLHGVLLVARSKGATKVLLSPIITIKRVASSTWCVDCPINQRATRGCQMEDVTLVQRTLEEEGYPKRLWEVYNVKQLNRLQRVVDGAGLGRSWDALIRFSLADKGC